MSRRYGHSPSASSSSHTLPPHLTVPPLPPRIHRQLFLHLRPDYLLVTPGNGKSVDGVKISWDVKGQVEAWNGEVVDESDEGIELGGILGIVRLWDAAYLLVFLPSTKAPSPLFPNHVHRHNDPSSSREAGPSAHTVHTLANVHPIPLTHDLAENALNRLRAIQSKRRARKASAARGPIKWNNLFAGLKINASGPPEELQGLADQTSDEESDSENGSASESGLTSSRSRESSVAPEADESPMNPPTPSKNSAAGKRFSLQWGKFAPRLGNQRQGDKGKSPGSTLEEEDVDIAAAATQSSSEDVPGNAGPTPRLDAPQRRELESKVIRQIIREFSSGAFFYSFDFDLTHTLQHKRRRVTARKASSSALKDLICTDDAQMFSPGSDAPHPFPGDITPDDFVEPDIQVPLWRRVDRRFFWNEWLSRDFIDAGLHSFILPMCQGWVQTSSFDIPVPPNPLDPTTSLGSVSVDLVVISRRSRDRAGLRYQRRGIDDEGHVANFVETEMITRAKVEGKVSLFSFVQIRGSIPLRWSQSPYSMKPPPVLDKPVNQTYSLANLHFDDITSRYGPTTIVNLSEQTGKEGLVTNGYKEIVNDLARKDLKYVEFDFHAKCHGMQWENISELVDELDCAGMGYLWTLQGESIREQTGVFRTNCIDCLDRTNVVQSAIARRVLSVMLTQLGLIPDPATSDIERVFNDVWANNGDMLSLCYAHTSALKGDFVRTGKRDVQGMLHDGISSISRMFYGAVSDYFDQAVISFLLGHRNLGVFNEFLENLESSDASTLIQLSRVRAAAIETSSARVLNEGEQRLAGWTLLSPEDRNIKISPKLEEKVLLLTKDAIYVVSFNYSLEKVVGFTRIPLKSVSSLQKGSYILSPLQEAGRDPAENAGFVISFSPLDEDTRYSTYSIRNRADPTLYSPSKSPATTDIPDTPPKPSSENGDTEYFAFKVLPREFAVRATAGVVDDDEEDDHESGETCREVAQRIVKRIMDQCQKAGVAVDDNFVVEQDVVSLAEAQRSTSLIQRMDYAVKRFLWL